MLKSFFVIVLVCKTHNYTNIFFRGTLILPMIEASLFCCFFLLKIVPFLLTKLIFASK